MAHHATADPYDKQRTATVEYAEKHKLQELFSHLLQLTVFNRPEDPRTFMRDEVRKMRTSEPSALFADTELGMMFELVDVTKQKYITLPQLRNAYANLSHDGSKLDDSQLPADVIASQKVTQEQFKAILGSQLQTQNHWRK